MSKGLVIWSMIQLISVCSVVQSKGPVVSAKGSRIKGLVQPGYAKFLGVPYAVVDKNNSFGPAKPHPGFDHVFEAFESKVCLQVVKDVIVGTVDCLTVDIFVPSVNHEVHELLPVMVWIKSGWGTTGSNAKFNSPNLLVRNNVIVVSVNYRLGPYGFMCLDTPEVPGNQGLKDQVLALRWIKENIEAFRGNPKKITAFGGASVNLHLFSPYEKLFQRAIIQSDSAVIPLWAKKFDYMKSISKLAKESGHHVSDIHEIQKFLLSADPHKIIEACGSASYPSIEKEFDGVESFISEHPRNIISAKARSTPVIIGYNDLPKDDFKWFEIFALDFDIEKGTDDFDYAQNIIKRFYFGEGNVTESYMHVDFFLLHPIHRMAEQLMRSGASLVYRYIFSYSGGRKVRHQKKSPKVWAGLDDLSYLFDQETFDKETSHEDQLMIDRMTTMWTNFAKFGDPTPKITELIPIKWEPITKKTHPYLNIDLKLSQGSRAAHDRMAFWDLFYKYYKKYLK